MWLIGKTKLSRNTKKKERERKIEKIWEDMEEGTPLSIGTQVLAGVILLRKYTVIRLT